MTAPAATQVTAPKPAKRATPAKGTWSKLTPTQTALLTTAAAGNGYIHRGAAVDGDATVSTLRALEMRGLLVLETRTSGKRQIVTGGRLTRFGYKRVGATEPTPAPATTAQINSHRGHGAAYGNEGGEGYDPDTERRMLTEMRAAMIEAAKPLDETTRVGQYHLRIHEAGVRGSVYRIELTHGGVLVRYGHYGDATFDRAYSTEAEAWAIHNTVIQLLADGLTPTAVASLTIDA